MSDILTKERYSPAISEALRIVMDAAIEKKLPRGEMAVLVDYFIEAFLPSTTVNAAIMMFREHGTAEEKIHGLKEYINSILESYFSEETNVFLTAMTTTIQSHAEALSRDTKKNYVDVSGARLETASHNHEIIQILSDASKEFLRTLGHRYKAMYANQLPTGSNMGVSFS